MTRRDLRDRGRPGHCEASQLAQVPILAEPVRVVRVFGNDDLADHMREADPRRVLPARETLAGSLVAGARVLHRFTQPILQRSCLRRGFVPRSPVSSRAQSNDLSRLDRRWESNYFFEWCVWLGYAVAGFAYAPLGLIALAPQAIILASIFGVTGIPPTEKQALRSKGDAYRDYQKRVSKFVPMPPKRARPSV